MTQEVLEGVLLERVGRFRYVSSIWSALSCSLENKLVQVRKVLIDYLDQL